MELTGATNTNPEGTVWIPVTTLRAFSESAFTLLGLPEEDARICTDVLISSDLRGIASHGVGRLKMYVDRIRAGMLEPVTRTEVVRDTPTIAVIDGHHGMGQVIAVRSMRLAIGKAKASGLGAVAVRNSSHFGIAGYYPLMAVAEGMVGLAASNARPSVFPTHGAQAMFGTNPIAFGVPSDEACPFLFDAATAVAPRGKLEVHARAGKEIPSGWAADLTGTRATNTDAVLAGLDVGEYGLLPLGGLGEILGGHKGYGLATMVELLSAAFQGGAFLLDLASFTPDGAPRKQQLGHFFLAMNIEAFDDPAAFRRRTGEILRALRAAKRLPGAERIYTAGEKEWEAEQRTLSRGVPANRKLQEDLRAVREILGIIKPALPF